MLTTSHGFIAYLFFRRRGKKCWLPAVLGSISPDLPQMVIYIFGGAFFLMHGQLTGSDLQVWAHGLWMWSNIASLFHSLLFWAVLGALSLCFAAARQKRYQAMGQAFVLGGLSHIMIDVFTHQQGWVWNYFYPIVASPVHGIINYKSWPFFLAEHLVMAIIIGNLLRKRRRLRRLAQQPASVDALR